MDNPTLASLLDTRARSSPGAVAIVAPAQASLTYDGLRRQVVATTAALRAAGVGPEDRVAVALPPGPELAVAFLAVASACGCAPLNPGYRARELEFYLGDLRPSAVILPATGGEAARQVAREQAIPVLDLSPAPRGQAAGIFNLSGARANAPRSERLAQPGDVGLLLHTSGTTSRPKLVPLTQANLCASASNIAASLGLTEEDRCLDVMPLFHIHGLMVLLASLAAGGSVACPLGFDAARFFAWVEECRPTWYSAVPTIHRAVLAEARERGVLGAGHRLRFVRSCSAPLPVRLAEDVEQALGVPVIEAYGMTEASHQIATNPLPPGQRRPGSVGRASGTEVAILDAEGQALAAGESGEIAIRGPGVVRDGRVWFRTGDAGYLDPEGYLFITGRLKELINRGGEKVSPYEVEEALASHGAVAEVVSFPMPHATLGDDVAAAVVLRPGAAASEEALRSWVAGQLAEFKIPSRIVVVGRIPTGASGKAQRLALAERLGLSGEARRADFVAPRSAVEGTLAGLWADVLGLARVGVHDNFFELGGDSISASRILTRVGAALAVHLPVSALLERPTVGALAEKVETARESGVAALAPVTAGEPAEDRPLTFAQERMWFVDQLDRGNPVYNRPAFLRLLGPLDIDALRRSLGEIVRRHATLRASFVAVDGRPTLRIGAPWLPELAVVDLGSRPLADREAEAQRLAVEEARRPFDLARGPLVRASLLRIAPEDHLFLLTFHHIVYDGWADTVLRWELATLYETFSGGRPSPLPELPVQCADLARAQRRALAGPAEAEHLAYWSRSLGGPLPVLGLPTDRPRPPVRSFAGAQQRLLLSSELAQRLRALSRREGATLFMTLLAAFTALLHRYTGQDDVVVGTFVAGRGRREAEGLLGCFMNVLALRGDLSGDPSFRELIARTRQTALGAYAHQDLPFERLVEALRPARDESRPPLFQVVFALRNLPQLGTPARELRIEPFKVDRGVAGFDLSLEIEERPQGLACAFEFNTDLFERATIVRMGEHLRMLLTAVAEDPDQRLSRLPLLTAAERHRLLEEWTDTAADFPLDQGFAAQFEAQVRRTPTAVAVVADEGTLAYAELNARANRLARLLVGAGVGPDRVVALLAERSLDLLVWIVAVFKAGGAYLPLDPRHPAARHATVLGQSGAALVLVADEHRAVLTDALARLPEGARPRVLDGAARRAVDPDASDLPPRSGPRDLVYVIYTSGSTGLPKGAMVEQVGMVNHLHTKIQGLALTGADTVAQTASQCFDISVWQSLAALLAGGRVRIVGDEVAHDTVRLLDLVDREGVTVLEIVPSLLASAFDSDAGPPEGHPPLRRLRWLIVGGEAFPPALCRRWLSAYPRVPVVNGYGPTECADDVARHFITEAPEVTASHVPIGRPIANLRIYVVDRSLSPVPIGVTGELCVGGIGVGRGYLNDPERTAEAFRPDPFVATPGARLYRTGDLARWRADGTLEFLGRIDHQLKVRGHRIEPGEIEAALARVPGVKEAVVVAWDHGVDKRLVAYVVPVEAGRLSSKELRERLKMTLPAFMVPDLFVQLPAMPLNPNGKLDRRALPAPDPSQAARELDSVPPRTPVERQLAAIWADVLGVQRVGVHDNFFDLGGHSLLATRVAARVRDTFQLDVPLRVFFQAPTVATFAKHIEAEEPEREARLLAEVEALSDEETKRLLGQDER